jgi:hypothetical protein
MGRPAAQAGLQHTAPYFSLEGGPRPGDRQSLENERPTAGMARAFCGNGPREVRPPPRFLRADWFICGRGREPLRRAHPRTPGVGRIHRDVGFGLQARDSRGACHWARRETGFLRYALSLLVTGKLPERRLGEPEPSDIRTNPDVSIEKPEQFLGWLGFGVPNIVLLGGIHLQIVKFKVP